MEVLILQVFVSLALVAGSLLLFAHSMRQRDHQHADRLSLLPLADDGPRASDAGAGADGPKNHDSRRTDADRNA